MALTKRQKQNVIRDIQAHDSDTGSAKVQISLLTRQIEELTKHLRKNKKDNHSRKGLLDMVSKRRKHIKYLKTKDPKQFNTLAKKIGLKEVEV